MKERRWTLWVRDERGKRHRGVVSYGDEAPAEAPTPAAEFRIALMARPTHVSRAPAATAICVPKLAKTRAIVDRRAAAIDERALIASLKQGTLPAALHVQYEAGRIVLPAGEVHATEVFPRGTPNVDLEHLALVLVDQAHAEAMAPYTAIIRRELRVPGGANPLLVLEARLSPADPAERPPARAPGISRLRAALRRMQRGALPQVGVETLIDDLRFLRLFEREPHPLRRAALDRLLADVVGASPRARPKRRRAPILRMQRREGA